MELSEELTADVQFLRPVGHVIVFVPDKKKHREGTFLEPATPDLFDGSIVGIIDADKGRPFTEVIEYILE
jgi:hypothetical protein